MQLVDADKGIGGGSRQPVRAEKFMASGGSAANTIHGLARLGVETAFIGTVGNDSFGDFFMSDMKACGIIPLLIA